MKIYWIRLHGHIDGGVIVYSTRSAAFTNALFAVDISRQDAARILRTARRHSLYSVERG